MNISSISSKHDYALLLSANHELEQLYYQQHNPCLALHISRNYNLLQKQEINRSHQKLWREKAKLWWKLYSSKRSEMKIGFFYDENELFLNI